MHSTATELERPIMRPAAATRPYALIVEDEAALVELIRYNLIKENLYASNVAALSAIRAPRAIVSPTP